jgi:hypothetical protein
MAMSRICAIAWRRACRSPRFPSVTSFSMLVLDQRCRHVGEHGAAMLAGAIELAMGVSVTHVRTPHKAQRP